MPSSTSLFSMTIARMQNRTERTSSKPIVRATLLTPRLADRSRMTFNGRMLAACTMGIRPKISAVTNPMATPPALIQEFGDTVDGRLLGFQRVGHRLCRDIGEVLVDGLDGGIGVRLVCRCYIDRAIRHRSIGSRGLVVMSRDEQQAAGLGKHARICG